MGPLEEGPPFPVLDGPPAPLSARCPEGPALRCRAYRKAGRALNGLGGQCMEYATKLRWILLREGLGVRYDIRVVAYLGRNRNVQLAPRRNRNRTPLWAL